MFRVALTLGALVVALLAWTWWRGPAVVARSRALEWQPGVVDEGAISFFEEGGLRFVRSRPSEVLAIQRAGQWLAVDDAFSFTFFERDGARWYAIAERQLRFEAFAVVTSQDDGETFVEQLVPLPVAQAAVQAFEVDGRTLTVWFDQGCPVAEPAWQWAPERAWAQRHPSDERTACGVRSRDGGRTWRLVR